VCYSFYDTLSNKVIFRDITDRENREQRLAVLNRTFRHNVRNDLDVVPAYADHVDDEELRTGIRGSTTNLLELSQKARDAETVMTERTDSSESVNLHDVALLWYLSELYSVRNLVSRRSVCKRGGLHHCSDYCRVGCDFSNTV